ncbi:cytochrome c family protein [Elioraea tepida]|uniref:Cytochrome c family protein n=1 Tax=Elioraea tepida TaxID=2843330 RepID=A0A975U063_9PROT|nr:cytochrome c family protein [Elioraea tepida]QXM23885.1 cytochrome c family protein [Elioraea tepida]
MSRLGVPMLAAAALLWQALPASAEDAAAGQRVFAQCRACHTVDKGGRNGVGPNLWGIVGSPAGKREGFRYSANMQELAQGGLVWTRENLDKYLENPKSLVPRGSMAFAGIRNPEQRANLIAYLETLK